MVTPPVLADGHAVRRGARVIACVFENGRQRIYRATVHGIAVGGKVLSLRTLNTRRGLLASAHECIRLSCYGMPYEPEAYFRLTGRAPETLALEAA